MKHRSFHARETGTTLVLLAVFIVALFGFMALSVDVANVLNRQRAANVGTDAAALAGVALLTNSPQSSTAVIAEATTIAAANGVTAAELAAGGGIQLGVWTPASNPAPGQPLGTFSVSGAPWNALRVAAKRTVQLAFGTVVGMTAMTPAVHSVAQIGSANNVPGLIPFGVTTNELNGVHWGDTITVNWQGSGNWGKLNLCDINMSSNPNFNNYMTNGVPCSISIGQQFDPGTGNAGVNNAFNARIAANPLVVIPVVNAFGNGKSSKVTIEGFVVALLVSSGKNGSGWSGQIQILHGFTGNTAGGSSGPPYALARVLVE